MTICTIAYINASPLDNTKAMELFVERSESVLGTKANACFANDFDWYLVRGFRKRELVTSNKTSCGTSFWSRFSRRSLISAPGNAVKRAGCLADIVMFENGEIAHGQYTDAGWQRRYWRIIGEHGDDYVAFLTCHF